MVLATVPNPVFGTGHTSRRVGLLNEKGLDKVSPDTEYVRQVGLSSYL
jgi:hypothetical protein